MSHLAYSYMQILYCFVKDKENTVTYNSIFSLNGNFYGYAIKDLENYVPIYLDNSILLIRLNLLSARK